MVLFNYINPLYYACAWTVIHSIWQVFLIVLIAALVQTMLRNHSANTRYNVLLSSMFLIVAASITTFLYYYNLSPEAMIGLEALSINNTDVILNSSASVIEETASQSLWTLENMATYVNNNIYIIVMIWLAGMVLALLKLMGNISYVFYLKNNMNFPVDEYWQQTLNVISKKISLTKTVEILESALVRSPVVLGHLKPIIFFPIGAINRLSVEEVEAILAHELAHISRNDYLMNIAISIIESLYYFNPAMWWLSSQIKVEREHCCDDIAISYTGNPLHYAKSLVAVQEMAIYTPHLAMAFAGNHKKNQLLLRVNRMFKSKSKTFNVREKGIASVIVCCLVALIFISSKPIDNANHCLPLIPESSGSPTFLKYTYNNKLDSLEIDFEVNDGDYNYSDHWHDVKMKIRNRHVVSFNLNGLEIAGNDISRFENLIEQILLEQNVPVEEPISDLEEVNSNKDHVIYDELINEMNNDRLLKLATLNQIYINTNKLRINDKLVPKGIHEKYLPYFQKLNDQVKILQEGITISVVLDQNGMILQEEKIGNISLPENEFHQDTSIHSKILQAQKYQEDVKNNISKYDETKFDTWLEIQLMKDGYIHDLLQYSLVWDKEEMLINGKPVDEKDLYKYIKKREELTGLTITDNFMKTKWVNNK